MSESLCRFMPPKSYDSEIKTLRFVYETEFRRLRRPFIHPVYAVHLVTSGSAKLKVDGREYPISEGSLFFAFPGLSFDITEDSDFVYMYVSYMGRGASRLMAELDICPERPVYPDSGHLSAFWHESIRRLHMGNANLVTECVLLYTLSFIGEETVADSHDAEGAFSAIRDYVDRNFTDPDMSLRRLALIFSYTEKYLSALFPKHMKQGFSQYLTDLRIQYAEELIEGGESVVGRIAERCGYRDPMYFSKVFRRRTGRSPMEYIRFAAANRARGLGKYLN